METDAALLATRRPMVAFLRSLTAKDGKKTVASHKEELVLTQKVQSRNSWRVPEENVPTT